MKKLLLLLACALLLASCGQQVKTDKPTVVATIYPLYDWAREVLGPENEDIALTLLVDAGTDLHSYQPSVADIARLADCDVFLYVGGESDEWVEDALKNARNPRMQVVNLMTLLADRVQEETLLEGMEGEAEEADEHLWLSLENARLAVEAYAQIFASLDEAGAERYAANAAAYGEKLTALDGAYREAVAQGRVKTLLFADRFPFRYLTMDYGLGAYAAFNGCSAETEASFETVIFLAGKVDELGLSAVLKIEGSDGRMARTVVENTAAKNAAVLTLNSLQGVPAPGETYLSVMTENLSVLKEALR